MDEKPIVHLRHFKDGYPLCWPLEQEGSFRGSYKEGETTCKKCLAALEDE